MRNLSDHFSKWICAQFADQYKITTVEDALQLSDADILKLRGIGKMFIYSLRNLGPIPPLTVTQREKIYKIFEKINKQILASYGIHSDMRILATQQIVDKLIDIINQNRANQ